MLLQTLGGLALEGSSFRRPKPLLLLAYLALEGPKDRRYLSELFWPAAAEPMTSLRMALSQLRRGIPEAIKIEGSRLEALVETDATRLLLNLEQSDLAEATARYRGPFLEGFYLADCGAELEEWIFSTREFLAERIREALVRLAETEASIGQFVTAAQHAEAAYRLPGAPEPEPETLARLHTLLVAGESLWAHDLQKVADVYGIRLELTSSAAQDQLRQLVTSGVARHLTAAPNNLPTPTTSFVGRDPELIELARLLVEPDTRFITITGGGGVGKTRLALQAAHSEVQSGLFPDGIYLVFLEALTEAGLIASTIAHALNITLSDANGALTELTQAVKDKALLLVLDNYEHLLNGTAVVTELLQSCSKLKLLVTSRERLNLAGEQLFMLEGLPLPKDPLALDDAQYQDAVQLFIQRAKRVRLDFCLSAENLPNILTICRLVDGLPLAIELAAAWVRLMTVNEIAAELTRNLDLLAAGGRNLHERHQSLRATFDYSWKLLSPKEQMVLSRLSVLVGGFTREAASQVAGATLPLLASLSDKSLLRLLPNGRYDRHPLLYQYTNEKLLEHPKELTDLRNKHAEYFLWLAEMAEANHFGAEQVTWLKRLEQDKDNLRAALEWTFSGGASETGLRLAAALYHFWYYRSYLQEGETWLRLALEVAATNSAWDTLRSRLLSAAGALANERGDDQRAMRLFEERLRLTQAIKDRVGQAAALNSLGIIAWGQQDHSKAQALMEASLKLRRALGKPYLVSVSLNNLGLVALARGKLDEARTFLEESLSISREIGDEMGIAMALANLGAVALEQRDCQQAERLLREALPRYHALGDRTALTQCLENFAAIASLRGQPEAAARLAGAAAALRETIGAILRPAELFRHERDLAPARAALPEETFATAWEQGRLMTLDEAISYALVKRESEPEESDGHN
jgi:predicted ATPase